MCDCINLSVQLAQSEDVLSVTDEGPGGLFANPSGASVAPRNTSSDSAVPSTGCGRVVFCFRAQSHDKFMVGE